MASMISIVMAAKRGITKLHMPHWSGVMDHVEIAIVDGVPGPWAKFYSPMNKSMNMRDPVLVLIGASFSFPLVVDPGRVSWTPYQGPAHDSAAYVQASESFARFYSEFCMGVA